MKLLSRITALFRARATAKLTPTEEIPEDQIPIELDGLITQEAYVWVVEQTKRRLGKSRHLFRLQLGYLFYTELDGNSWRQLNLVHLVQLLAGEDRATWGEKVGWYVDLHLADQSALEALLASFAEASGRLTVRMHTKEAYVRFPMEGYILKQVVPELYAALALELPGQFHILQRGEVSRWGIDEDELLWTAYANLSDRRDQIQVVEEQGDGFVLVSLVEKDYAAAFAADFGNHCAEWIGKMGAMVALPTKGNVFIYPVSDPNAFNAAFTKMAELVNRCHQEGPSPLSNELYWFHHNHFERFPKIMDGHTLTYSIPNRLLAYLRTPLAHPAFNSDLKDNLLEGYWEGYYEYGQGFRAPLLGSRREFQLTLRSKSGQLEGTCIDEDHSGQAGVWGFVDRELISFIKKFPGAPTQDVHYTGFFDAGEISFTGTWVIDEGNGRVCSGSWAMVKL